MNRHRSTATEFQRRRRGQRGAILPVVFLTMGVLAVIGYSISTYLQRSYSQMVDEDTRLDAQMLASDIKEFGKYLLLYEKILYQYKPLSLPETTRRADLHAVWSQPFGVVKPANPSIVNACGGYSAVVDFVGDMRLRRLDASQTAGTEVFCPEYLRHSDMTGELLEFMLLDRWSRRGSANILKGYNLESSTMANVVRPKIAGQRGHYVVDIHLGQSQEGVDDPNWLDDPDNFIFLSYGQRIAERMKQLNLTAKLSFEIMTDGRGFVPSSAERFVKITSTIEFKGVLRAGHFTDSESFILTVPTIKDFAIFMPYPTRGDGTSLVSGPVNGAAHRPTPTRSWREAMKIRPNSTIFGRVYFNGDIDLPLDQLPTFTETVFISGELKNMPDLTDEANLKKLRNKFRKGIITHFSASRFVISGQCESATLRSGAIWAADINNETQLYCKDDATGTDYGIREYVAKPKNLCTESKAIVTNGVVDYDFSGNTTADPVAVGSCGDPNPRFVEAVREIVVRPGPGATAPIAFIGAPTEKLQVIPSDASIYGTIVGGFIDAAPGTNFYSFASMAVGLPGIGSQEALENYSEQANSIVGGIGVPLKNFPLVRSAKDGVN